jgi:HlyD family secretion protein
MAFASEPTEKSPFRAAALARLNNPEQLDRLLTVTSARSWIALIVFMLLIATAIGWSIVGTLSTYVSGSGLFLNEGGRILAAAAPGPGTLSEIMVARGDEVTKGQVVARIFSTDAEIQIANARALVDERQAELSRLKAVNEAELRDKRSAFGKRREALTAQREAALARSETLKQKLADEEQLLRRQIVTRSVVLQTRTQYDQTLNEVADITAQLAQIDSQEIDAAFEADQRIKNAEFSLSDADRRLAELLESNRSGSQVLAPADGTVDAIQANVGALLSRGQSILSVETPGTSVELLLFVPVRDGGDQLEAGERVNIAPNWVRREEEGTLIGEIREVSKFPVTPDEMRALVQNEELVRSFSASGPTYVAHVRLVKDPNTVSGYAWTSSRGAEEPITSGGFATADVLIREEHPIGLVIPTLRRWAGM